MDYSISVMGFTNYFAVIYVQSDKLLQYNNLLFSLYENEIELAVISNSPNFHNPLQLDKLIE